MYTHQKQKTPLTLENVPEVGLELHSNPCKHWNPQETCGVWPDPSPVRPNPKPDMLTLSTPPSTIQAFPPPTTPKGCRFF